jgi:hypothetical protein
MYLIWFSDTRQLVGATIRKFRSVVVAIRSSSLKTEEIRSVNEAEKIPDRKISLDVVTRWNSTFEMLKKVDESRFAIESLGFHDDNGDESWMAKDPTDPSAKNAEHKTLELFHSDWDFIGDLIPVCRFA